MDLNSPSAPCWDNRSPSKPPASWGASWSSCAEIRLAMGLITRLTRTFPSARCVATADLSAMGVRVAKSYGESACPGCGRESTNSSRQVGRLIGSLKTTSRNCARSEASEHGPRNTLPCARCESRMPFRRQTSGSCGARRASMAFAHRTTTDSACGGVATMARLCRTVFMDCRSPHHSQP